MNNPDSETEEKAMSLIIDSVLDLIRTTEEPALRQMLMFRGRLLLLELEIMRLNRIVIRMAQ
jgi:hypothetical protein